jgi:hypothetical protein
MKVLLLAPQPFYMERGTPIAVDLILKVLSERGDQIDLVTYHIGEDVAYDHVNLRRIPRVPFLKSVPPGFSWRKVFCDVLLFFKALGLLLRNRYDYVHAVEESVFIALVILNCGKFHTFTIWTQLGPADGRALPGDVQTVFPGAILPGGIAVRHANAVVLCDARRSKSPSTAQRKFLCCGMCPGRR